MAQRMRLAAIASCCDQIHAAIEQQRAGDFDALLWEVDQRAELHRLLYEEE